MKHVIEQIIFVYRILSPLCYDLLRYVGRDVATRSLHSWAPLASKRRNSGLAVRLPLMVMGIWVMEVSPPYVGESMCRCVSVLRW